MATPLQPNDRIVLKQRGVSDRIVRAMEDSRPPQVQPVIVQQPARPIIVHEHYDPWWPHHRYGCGCY